jgi:hypothetical protein
MNLNQKSSADQIIENLLSIDVDGETINYIIEGTNLKYQILKQLIMQSSDFDINNLLEERNSFHDSGRNNHLIEIMTNKSNENELKHRLEMIEDDLRVIREFIHARGLADVFKEPSKTSEEVWNNINNIEIACDLSSDESLSWRLYRD